MSHVLTPAATWTTNVLGPDNGDLANQEAWNNGLQPLTDRTYWAKGALHGIQNPVHLHCVDGANLELNAISAVVTADRVLTSGAGAGAHTINATAKKEGGGALAANTWYFLYAWWNGALDFLVSTSGPKSNLRYRATDDSQVYLGCLRTGAGGTILPFRSTRGHYSYCAPQLVVNGPVPPPVGPTNLSLASFVPPHSTISHLWWRLNNTSDATSEEMTLRTNGLASGFGPIQVPPKTAAAAYAGSIGSIELPTDNAQTIQWSLTRGTNDTLLYLYVTGFRE